MTRRTQGHTHFWSMLAIGATVATGAVGTVQAQEGGPDAPAVAETTTETETTFQTTTTAPGGGNRNKKNNRNKNNRNKNNRNRALPNTGGEPWLMAFGGLALAGSALLLRRKLDMA